MRTPELMLEEDRVRSPSWKRSRRTGNLVLRWLIDRWWVRVTIFERPIGSDRFAFAIGSGDDVRFSPRSFLSEDEAIRAVMMVLKDIQAEVLR